MPSVHDPTADAHNYRHQGRNQCEYGEISVMLLVVAIQHEQEYRGDAHRTENEYEQHSENILP